MEVDDGGAVRERRRRRRAARAEPRQGVPGDRSSGSATTPAIRTARATTTSISWNELRDRVAPDRRRPRRARRRARATRSRSCSTTAPSSSRSTSAAVSLGGVPFSIYQTSSPEQIQYVVSDAGARSRSSRRRSSSASTKAREDLPELEHVIVVDGDGGDHTLEELEAMDPDFDPAETVDDDRARRPADPDLHLGHHRPAEGRPAHPPQPDDA